MSNFLKVSFFLVIQILSSVAFAQQQVHRCYSDERLQKFIQKHPDLQKTLDDHDALFQQQGNSSGHSRAVITIPVVVHVIHDGDAVGVSENISDAQIISQIEVLNIDYRKRNADTTNTPLEFKSLGADVEIEFCLAQVDPDGNPTNGIERHNFGLPDYDDDFIDNTVMPQTIWDRDNYLNIYTARLGGSVAGVLGYSSLPGFPASSDAVVVGFRFFGNTGNVQTPFHLGRTATHEVGHWLGLFHPWGNFGGCNQDDNINDTPRSSDPYFGCPSYPQSNCSPSEMFMNYMEYVNDNCMNLFTLGQKARIQFIMNNVRTSVLASNACLGTPQFTVDAGITNLLFPLSSTCESSIVPLVEIRNTGAQTISTLNIIYQINQGVLQQFVWNGSLAFGEKDTIALPAVMGQIGTNNLLVALNNPNGLNDENNNNNEISFNFSVVGSVQNVALPIAEDYEFGFFPQNGWTIQNPDLDRTFELSNVGGFGNSGSGILFDNFNGTTANNPRGTSDGLVSPTFSLMNTTNSKITFDLAYASRNNNLRDSLKVLISTDCGLNWNIIYAKGGNSLATAPVTNLPFTPANTEWRKEEISLAAFENFPSLRVKFENRSDWGNFLYLDNINIVGEVVTGINDQDVSLEFSVAPNPSNAVFNLNLRSEITSPTEVLVYNTSGSQVYRADLGNVNATQHLINLTTFSSGVYFIKVIRSNAIIHHRILKQ